MHTVVFQNVSCGLSFVCFRGFVELKKMTLLCFKMSLVVCPLFALGLCGTKEKENDTDVNTV